MSSEQNENLIKLVTEQEILAVIQNSKQDKSPGSDGYTNEFYKTFKELLISVLCKLFNFILQKGVWPPTWNDSIISVLPKEGKDLTKCGSYRPVTLLNVDLKLFTAILANRLSAIVPYLVNKDQTGFVQGRLLSDNVRRVLNLVDLAGRSKEQVLMLTLDAEKAFDRLSWKFIFKTLKTFGFHDCFIDILKVMYRRPKAVVKVNGALSESFDLHRGVRQGDCLSPLIFVLCVEPFAESIRQNTNITGISVGGSEYKLGLYADDVMVTMTNVEKSLDNLMEEIQRYSEYSGYKLNIQKTEAMMIGEIDHNIKNKFEFKWDCDFLRYLGVYLPKDMGKLLEINYGKLTTQIKMEFNRWKILNLSIFQKIQSIKMTTLPRFLFLFQNLPSYIPPRYFREWDSLIRKFIWDEKKPRVKLKNLKLSKSGGGLALPDLQTYFTAAQMRNIMVWISDINVPKWKDIESNKMYLIKSAIFKIEDKKLKEEIKNNYCIENTLREFQKTFKKLKINKDDMIFLREISKDPDFKANKMDNIFNIWAEKGLVRFYQLFKNDELQSFEDLSKQFNIPKKHFHKYLQARSYVFCKLGKEVKHLHPLVVFLANYSNRTPTNIMSKLYKILSNQDEKITNIRLKWEEELLLKITDEDWMEICSNVHKTTGSLFWREFAWKILIQFFLTPKSMEKYKGNSKCWRNCGENEADYLHIFYTCKVIQIFWKEAIEIIEDLFQKKLELKPENVIIGKIPVNINPKQKYLFQILRVSALKMITKKWKKSNPPKTEEWITVIQEVYRNEKVTHKIRNKEHVFDKKWFIKVIGEN